MNSNLERVRERMRTLGCPAMIVSDTKMIGWLTGFTGSFGVAIVTLNSGVFITDSRYGIQAQGEVKELDVVSFAAPRTLIELLGEQIARLEISSIGFEPSVSFATWEQWTKKVPECLWTPQPDLLGPLRMVKTADEIAKIKAACVLADKCLENVQGMIQPGVSEYEVGLAIEFFFRRNGAGVAFSPIVASGVNSAKPHGRASEKIMETGDFVTLDLGGCLDGYNSDITRTFVIGKASDRQKMMYNRVLEAQVAACEALVAGANGKDVDALAREILDKDDLSQYFGHGLGHGLGADVHDGGRLFYTYDQPIEVGQVWTVEPGVYIPGYGGLRIEDDVVVTENGPEIITHFPKHLIELGV